MYKVVDKEKISEVTTRLEIDAPLIAAKAQAGQFVILRLHDKSERIPLTLSDWSRERGTITIIFQHMGRSTHELARLNVGDAVRDVVGPLGTPSHIEDFGTVVCVGGGIGLVGNADVIVASDDAKFGLPEVERGALGAATHLSRLVPQHMMRRLFYTAATVDAATLQRYGSVHEVVPRAELDEAALRVARDIAAKDTRVIRAAKEALNFIDVQRVNSSYRMEQGFTFELNLSGVSDEHRDEFAGTQKGAAK